MPEGLNSQTDQISRWVYVFWRSGFDPKKRARDYCKCVETSPAVQRGCDVQCRLIDVGGSSDPVTKHWSGKTIEVVGVRNDEKVDSLMNPSVFCKEIFGLVERLCK